MKKKTKSLLELIRELLGYDRPEVKEVLAGATGVDESAATRLITRAAGGSDTGDSDTADDDKKGDNKGDNPYSRENKDSGSAPRSENTENSENSDDKGGDKEDDKNKGGDDGKKSCPYATKRAIVESLNEIRRFAEEHHLAATVVRALLALLADMALGALKGKVSRHVLDALLKSFNYERAVDEAFRKGELQGRNTAIIEKHFPESDDGLPHLNGTVYDGNPGSSIFDIAKDAR